MKNSNSQNANEKIGKRLQLIRTENNYSQDDIAKELGLTKKSVTDYEKGFSKISLENLQKISIFFHKPISYFFDEEADVLGRLEKKIDILFNMFINPESEINQKLEINAQLGLKDFLIAKGIKDTVTLRELEMYFRFACEKQNYNFDDIWNT